MICSFCGKEIEDNSKFCKFCGSKIEGKIPVRAEDASIKADYSVEFCC